MKGRQGYAAETDPPPGARPARDPGVSAVAHGVIAALTRERDEARQERDEARQERDEARASQRAEAERANLLADALHGSYGTEHRWREDYARAVRERDEARARAREYYHDLRQEVSDYIWNKHYARDGEEHDWLGRPETPEAA